MKHIKKILIWALIWVFFWSSHIHAFLWEDLGLDIYGQIDRNLKWLEQKQYEYELTAQGKGTVNDVLAPIFADYGIACNIGSSADIESMLAGNNIAKIMERCWWENEDVPALLAERVTNALSYIKSTYTQRAETKAQKTFEVERIGLYSDGNIENSPFDLVEDLIQIDSIIFSKELEYEWVENKNTSESVQDVVDEVFNDPIINTGTNITDWVQEIADDIEDIFVWNDEEQEDIIEYLDYHNYVCIDQNQSGLDDAITDDIIWNIEWYGPYVSNPSYWEYPDGIVPIGWWWIGPTLWWESLSWNYTPIRDDFPCDWWFCITIEFQKNDYGLAWGETSTIESVLKKSGQHLEKAANANPTQRKQTTNNFELSSIIENLPDMLRGFWVEVITKPVPILDIQNDRENNVNWDRFERENLARKYFNNLWLNYDRQNDLTNFNSTEYEQKIIQTAWWMPITYSEDRNNQLKLFNNALRENNRIVSQSVNNEIITKDLEQFSDLFAELEIFVMAIEDFVFSFTGNLWEMKEIPTRSP